MSEELKKEIEETKKLPRRQRRKKERELQNKYHNKSIRILSGKCFTKSEAINRKDKRELIKDKKFILEIIKIIRKYFPQFDNFLDKLTDKRNQSYITYSMKTLIYTKLLALICGVTTMTDISDVATFDTEEMIDNLSNICGTKLDEIPYWQTIQDVIEELDIKEIVSIRKYMVNALISKNFPW